QARGDEPRRSGEVSDSAHTFPPRGERQPGRQSLGIEPERHVPPAAKASTGMRPMTYERRIQLLALAVGLPGSLVALILVWTGNFSSGCAWTLTFFIVVFWLGLGFSLLHLVIFSLQSISDLLDALLVKLLSMCVGR